MEDALKRSGAKATAIVCSGFEESLSGKLKTDPTKPLIAVDNFSSSWVKDCCELACIRGLGANAKYEHETGFCTGSSSSICTVETFSSQRDQYYFKKRWCRYTAL